MLDPISNRAAILLALMEEKAAPKPNEAVITACEVALRNMPDLYEHCRMHIDLSQPPEKEI